MKRNSCFALSVLSICFAIAGCGGASSDSQNFTAPPSTIQYLFVQSADSGTFVQSPDDPDVYILTLNGVRPTTTYFSDRPYRLAGYITTSDFVGSWNDTTDDSFLNDPPNAALQIDGAPADADAIVVELVDVLYDRATATAKYRTRIVHLAKDSVELFHARGDPASNMPATFASASLFIDSWYSKAWHKVRKAADDIADDAKKDVNEAADKLKKAVSDFEQAVQDTGKTLADMAKDPSKMLDMTDDAFLRLISLPLPSGLSSCLSVVPDPPLFDLFDKPSTEQANWMASIPDTIELKRLAMPGSHDTGTYPVNGLAPLGTELAKGKNEYASLFVALSTVKKYFPVDFPVTAHFALWSRAQAHTVKAQLAAGVRYLDLRLLPDPNNVKYHATHVLLGAEIESMLADISDFLTLHPKEIVILDFQHLFSNTGDDGGMSMLVAEALVNKLNTHFGTKLATSAVIADPNTATLRDLWSKNIQIIALFDSGPYGRMSLGAQRSVWSGGQNDVLHRYWPNKQTWFGSDGILKYLNENIAEANTFVRTSVIQGQMTPTFGLIVKRVGLALSIGTVKAQVSCLRATSGIAEDLIRSVTNHLEHLTGISVALSLQEAAQDYNPELKLWVEQNKPRHIVIADFIADYPELIAAIINSNK